jgi:hypothetical protein
MNDTIDKARAWDAIAEKNAEITQLREILRKAPKPNVRDASWLITYMDWWFQERQGALDKQLGRDGEP